MGSSRRAGVSGGGGRGGGLSFLAAGLVLLVAVMASVMRVPLKPEVVVADGEPFKPPVPLDGMSDYHLRTMPFPDLFRLFHTLEAPAEPLDGEYLAEMLE